MKAETFRTAKSTLVNVAKYCGHVLGCLASSLANVIREPGGKGGQVSG